MARKKKHELPSGTLRKPVYDHLEPVYDSKGKPVLLPNGKQKMKRVYVSITASSKTELNLKVSQFKANQKKRANLLKRAPISFRDARANYIESKSNILSASTIRGYKQMSTYYSLIDDIDIYKLTNNDIQE